MNDRLIVLRLRYLPRVEWVYGRANANVAMAAFRHGGPQGTCFAGPDLRVW